MRRNSDFRYVFNKGVSVANRFYVLYVIKKQGGLSTRVGFSVSKKVGNAVVRNKTKRILREVFRKRIHSFTDCCDLVVIVRKHADELSYVEVEKQILQLLHRVKLL